MLTFPDGQDKFILSRKRVLTYGIYGYVDILIVLALEKLSLIFNLDALCGLICYVVDSLGLKDMLDIIFVGRIFNF